MTYNVLLRPAAEDDLESVAVYTKQKWGGRQAQRYVTALGMDIQSLADFPMRHAVYRSNKREFRKLSSGHHLVFYLIVENTVEIVRVLHERMDIEQHL